MSWMHPGAQDSLPHPSASAWCHRAALPGTLKFPRAGLPVPCKTCSTAVCTSPSVRTNPADLHTPARPALRPRCSKRTWAAMCWRARLAASTCPSKTWAAWRWQSPRASSASGGRRQQRRQQPKSSGGRQAAERQRQRVAATTASDAAGQAGAYACCLHAVWLVTVAVCRAGVSWRQHASHGSAGGGVLLYPAPCLRQCRCRPTGSWSTTAGVEPLERPHSPMHAHKHMRRAKRPKAPGSSPVPSRQELGGGMGDAPSAPVRDCQRPARELRSPLAGAPELYFTMVAAEKVYITEVAPAAPANGEFPGAGPEYR